MICYQFEVAMRKAVDALHEASAATKMLRLEAEDRAAIRTCLRHVRERLLSVDEHVRTATISGEVADALGLSRNVWTEDRDPA
jgi:hypothetical protein